jgi:flagellar biosynthesis protein FliQ
MSFICSFMHSDHIRLINSGGVIISLAHLTRFMIPGIISGVLSAILTAINRVDDYPHISAEIRLKGPRSMAGLQLAGVGFSLAIGIVAGLIIGLLIKLINSNERENQFDDLEVYEPDFPDSMKHQQQE